MPFRPSLFNTSFAILHESYRKQTNTQAATMIILLSLLLFCASWAEGADIECDPSRRVAVNLQKTSRGNIVSPGFGSGQNYSTGIRCLVDLTTSNRTHIRVRINTIDIETSTTCRNDYLLFLEFASDGSQITKGRFCGDKPIAGLISGFRYLTLGFVSDHMKTGRGFNVSFEISYTKNLCQRGEFRCRNRKCINIIGAQLCDGHDDCGDGTDEERCEYPIVPPLKCGLPETAPILSGKLVDRIVGGSKARPGSWPWQVDMQAGYVEPNGHFCGGTLINAQWFITAAHCFPEYRLPYEIRIHLGNHHKFKRDPNEQIRYVKDYFIYGFNTSDFIRNGIFTAEHDFALGKLNAPVKFNSAIQPACLPLQFEELPMGKQCFATGWGVSRGSGLDDALKQAEHPVQKETACYQEHNAFKNKTMICAGRLEALNGLCSGDSGGPLVCQKSDGRWHVYGAASFVTQINLVGVICGLDNKPTVFNKVSAKIGYINWILSKN